MKFNIQRRAEVDYKITVEGGFYLTPDMQVRVINKMDEIEHLLKSEISKMPKATEDTAPLSMKKNRQGQRK